MTHHESITNELHIVPTGTLRTVFGVLVALTIVNFVLSMVDLGAFNIVLTLAICTLQGFLAMYYFAHVAFEKKIMVTFIVIPFVLIVLLVGGTLLDDTTRHYPHPQDIATPNIPKY